MGCDMSCAGNPTTENVDGHEVYTKEPRGAITLNNTARLVQQTEETAPRRNGGPSSDTGGDHGRAHSIVDMNQPSPSMKRPWKESSSSFEEPQMDEFTKESEKRGKVGMSKLKVSDKESVVLRRSQRRSSNQSSLVRTDQNHDSSSSCQRSIPVRGVLGSNNSCYMDSSLNSLFLFNDAFFDVLEPTTTQQEGGLKKRRKGNNQGSRSQQAATHIMQILRDEIEIPLNTNKILETGTMSKFRQTLSQFTNKRSYIGSEMDPEEFISTLFGDVLKTPRFYVIDGHHEGSHVFQTYADMTKSRNEIDVQTLLDYSFANSEITLDSIPKPGFILKIPVTDGRHLFGKIYPNLSINLGNFLKKSKENGDVVPRMLLSAVICLSGRHFTAFVREEISEYSPWWYLNSFSGATCIPKLEESLEKFKYSQSNSRMSFLLSNCYMCFYLPITTDSLYRNGDETI